MSLEDEYDLTGWNYFQQNTDSRGKGPARVSIDGKTWYPARVRPSAPSTPRTVGYITVDSAGRFRVHEVAGINEPPPAPSFPMEPEAKLPKIAYTLLRSKWRHAGHDDSRITDRDIDGLVEGALDHVEHAPFVAGALGDGSIIRWLQRNRELIQILFELGRIVLPLLKEAAKTP